MWGWGCLRVGGRVPVKVKSACSVYSSGFSCVAVITAVIETKACAIICSKSANARLSRPCPDVAPLQVCAAVQGLISTGCCSSLSDEQVSAGWLLRGCPGCL